MKNLFILFLFVCSSSHAACEVQAASLLVSLDLKDILVSTVPGASPAHKVADEAIARKRAELYACLKGTGLFTTNR